MIGNGSRKATLKDVYDMCHCFGGYGGFGGLFDPRGAFGYRTLVNFAGAMDAATKDSKGSKDERIDGEVIGLVPFKWGYGKMFVDRHGIVRVTNHKPPSHKYVVYGWSNREGKWYASEAYDDKEAAINRASLHLNHDSFDKTFRDVRAGKCVVKTVDQIKDVAVVAKVTYEDYVAQFDYGNSNANNPANFDADQSKRQKMFVSKIKGKILKTVKHEVPTVKYYVVSRRDFCINSGKPNTEWYTSTNIYKLEDAETEFKKWCDGVKKDGSKSGEYAIVSMPMGSHELPNFISGLNVEGMKVIKRVRVVAVNEVRVEEVEVSEDTKRV